MKFLGNIIWLICGGLLTAVEYLISSLLLMITIIGIPFGLQTLKLGMLALWPVPGHERDLDLHRWLLDLPDTPVFRVTAVHHDYRHSFRQTAFQDGRTGSFAVRKKYRLREKDSLSPDSPVVLPHTSASIDWQIIHSTNRICSTSTG